MLTRPRTVSSFQSREKNKDQELQYPYNINKLALYMRSIIDYNYEAKISEQEEKLLDSKQEKKLKDRLRNPNIRKAIEDIKDIKSNWDKERKSLSELVNLVTCPPDKHEKAKGLLLKELKEKFHSADAQKSWEVDLDGDKVAGSKDQAGKGHKGGGSQLKKTKEEIDKIMDELAALDKNGLGNEGNPAPPPPPNKKSKGKKRR
ncbi:MAG: hypothetical protein AAF195_03700 [Pseudomonadota bacterium]